MKLSDELTRQIPGINETKLTVNYENMSLTDLSFKNETVEIKIGENDCTHVEYLHHSKRDRRFTGSKNCVFITFFTPKSNDHDNTRLFSKHKIQILCFTQANITKADWLWKWLNDGQELSCVKLTKFKNISRFSLKFCSGFKGCLTDFYFVIFPELVVYKKHHFGKRFFEDQLEDGKYDIIKDVHPSIINFYKSFMKKYTEDGKYTSAAMLKNCNNIW